MNKQNRHTETKWLNRYLDGKWLLNLHILKYNSSEQFSDDVINDILNQGLSQLETECMSDEFDYFKIGFACLHFGRRGVALSIWHTGFWQQTCEIFCCNWYCYNRDISNMELLNSAEPCISHYEISIVAKEFQNIKEFAVTITSKKDFETYFINTYKEN